MMQDQSDDTSVLEGISAEFKAIRDSMTEEQETREVQKNRNLPLPVLSRHRIYIIYYNRPKPIGTGNFLRKNQKNLIQETARVVACCHRCTCMLHGMAT